MSLQVSSDDRMSLLSSPALDRNEQRSSCVQTAERLRGVGRAGLEWVGRRDIGSPMETKRSRLRSHRQLAEGIFAPPPGIHEQGEEVVSVGKYF